MTSTGAVSGLTGTTAHSLGYAPLCCSLAHTGPPPALAHRTRNHSRLPRDRIIPNKQQRTLVYDYLEPLYRRMRLLFRWYCVGPGTDIFNMTWNAFTTMVIDFELTEEKDPVHGLKLAVRSQRAAHRRLHSLAPPLFQDVSQQQTTVAASPSPCRCLTQCSLPSTWRLMWAPRSHAPSCRARPTQTAHCAVTSFWRCS